MSTASIHDIKKLQIPSGLSVASAELIDLLRRAAQEGRETLTDEEMTRECGKDTRVTGKGYSNLMRAINYVLREDGIHWARIRGANAIKRQAASETLTVAEATRKHIHRMSQSAMRKLSTVKPDDISEEERPEINAKIAHLSILSWMSSPGTKKKIEARADARSQLDLPKLLDALKG